MECCVSLSCFSARSAEIGVDSGIVLHIAFGMGLFVVA